jgi:hypothetical protein
MYPQYRIKSIAVFIFFLLLKTGIDLRQLFIFTISNQLVNKKNGVQITRHKKLFFDGFPAGRDVK